MLRPQRFTTFFLEFSIFWRNTSITIILKNHHPPPIWSSSCVFTQARKMDNCSFFHPINHQLLYSSLSVPLDVVWFFSAFHFASFPTTSYYPNCSRNDFFFLEGKNIWHVSPLPKLFQQSSDSLAKTCKALPNLSLNTCLRYISSLCTPDSANLDGSRLLGRYSCFTSGWGMLSSPTPVASPSPAWSSTLQTILKDWIPLRCHLPGKHHCPSQGCFHCIF